ncbi:MAG: HAD-IC family P-type ATPase, partial [Chitinophagaceae bacterium]
MPGTSININVISGLRETEVLLLQKQYGKNVFRFAAEHRFIHILLDIFREPMFIMLCIACSIYFILGEISEGIMMTVAIAIVSLISIYQEFKSSRAIRALKQFTETKITVIRDGQNKLINTEELVPGDVILLEEGMKIPADAMVIEKNDLSVDESIISGESLAVEKSLSEGQNLLYQGSTVNSGKCTAKITATGNNTVLGKIGKAVTGRNESKTLLQKQINKFVKRFALFGLVTFIIIFLVN